MLLETVVFCAGLAVGVSICRTYLADTLERARRARCPVCEAPPGFPCDPSVHDSNL